MKIKVLLTSILMFMAMVIVSPAPAQASHIGAGYIICALTTEKPVPGRMGDSVHSAKLSMYCTTTEPTLGFYARWQLYHSWDNKKTWHLTDGTAHYRLGPGKLPADKANAWLSAKARNVGGTTKCWAIQAQVKWGTGGYTAVRKTAWRGTRWGSAWCGGYLWQP